MSRIPKLATADALVILLLSIVCLFGTVLMFMNIAAGETKSAIGMLVIMVGPIFYYLAYQWNVARRILKTFENDEQQEWKRKELKYREANVVAEMWTYCVRAPLWLGALSASGVWGFQGYTWLRDGSLPSMSWQSIGLGVPQPSWIGVQKIISFFVDINIGFYLILAGFIVSALFLPAETDALTKAAELKDELKRAGKPVVFGLPDTSIRPQ